MRAVYIDEHDVEQLKVIREFLRSQGAEKAAGVVSELILRWLLTKPLDIHDEDPHSRRVA